MAPSSEHERRVRLLDAVGALAGFSAFGRFGCDRQPDVVRVDLRGARVFVGDAKATETAGITATRMRIAGYARALRSWRAAGFDVWVVLCAGPSTHSALDAWAEMLTTIFGVPASSAALGLSEGTGVEDHLVAVKIGRLFRRARTGLDDDPTR